MVDQSMPIGLAPTAPSPLPPRLTYQVRDFSTKHILQVAGFGGSKVLETKIKAITGAAPAANQFHQMDQTLTSGLSPLTWLILTENDDVVEKLMALDRTLCAVTTLSGARVFYETEGVDAATKLSKGALVDFSEGAFKAGDLRQTVVHHMPTLIMKLTKERFLVSTYRSFGDDLRGWIEKK